MSYICSDMYEMLMVKSCGVQLRKKNSMKFVGEDAIDAGGPTTELVNLVGDIFAQTDILFENYGGIGELCISIKAIAYGGSALQHIFRFFGRYIMYIWIVDRTMPLKLSIPLLKLIKGERVSLVDIKDADSVMFKMFERFLSFSEEEWDSYSDYWQRDIRTKNEQLRKMPTVYLPVGIGKSFWDAR